MCPLTVVARCALVLLFRPAHQNWVPVWTCAGPRKKSVVPCSNCKVQLEFNEEQREVVQLPQEEKAKAKA